MNCLANEHYQTFTITTLQPSQFCQQSEVTHNTRQEANNDEDDPRFDLSLSAVLVRESAYMFINTFNNQGTMQQQTIYSFLACLRDRAFPV